MKKEKSLVPIKIKRMLKKLGAELLPDTDKYRFRMDIPSETSDRIYKVSQNIDKGFYACGCPAWIFQKAAPQDRKPCKHLLAILPVLKQLNKLIPLSVYRKLIK